MPKKTKLDPAVPLDGVHFAGNVVPLTAKPAARRRKAAALAASEPWACEELPASQDPEDAEAGEPGQLRTAAEVKRFVLAGHATITLRSKKTGTRYTFSINQAKVSRDSKPAPHFVKVMYGPDNTADYTFMGTLFDGGTVYRHGRNSKLPEGDVRERAFWYVWKRVCFNNTLPDDVEVWHEGRCCRCGRKLTVPASIASGIGPECAGKMEMV
jgi:Family of unknown function (DUF6011)